MNTSKIHDNQTVRSFVEGYITSSSLCMDYPSMDDIFSGVLELSAEGSTSTRSLSRKVLFHIIRSCPFIDIESLSRATYGKYSYRSLAGYAAAARVASKAIEGSLKGMPCNDEGVDLVTRQEQALLDAEYNDELRALGLI